MTVHGLDEWITGFDDLPLRAEVAVEEQWAAAAALFVEHVRSQVHVLTGDLRASGHILPPTFAPGVVEQGVMFVGKLESLGGPVIISKKGKRYVKGEYGIYEQGRDGSHAFITRAYEAGGREMFLEALHLAFARLAEAWR